MSLRFGKPKVKGLNAAPEEEAASGFQRVLSKIIGFSKGIPARQKRLKIQAGLGPACGSKIVAEAAILPGLWPSSGAICTT